MCSRHRLLIELDDPTTRSDRGARRRRWTRSGCACRRVRPEHGGGAACLQSLTRTAPSSGIRSAADMALSTRRRERDDLGAGPRGRWAAAMPSGRTAAPLRRTAASDSASRSSEAASVGASNSLASSSLGVRGRSTRPLRSIRGDGVARRSLVDSRRTRRARSGSSGSPCRRPPERHIRLVIRGRNHPRTRRARRSAIAASRRARDADGADPPVLQDGERRDEHEAAPAAAARRSADGGGT